MARVDAEKIQQSIDKLVQKYSIEKLIFIMYRVIESDIDEADWANGRDITTLIEELIQGEATQMNRGL